MSKVDQNMSEQKIKDSEKNDAENNIQVEPLSDQEMDSVAGGTYQQQDPGTSELCSAVWCS